MKRLRPCDGCKRHVFASERACPFCQTELEPAPERVLLPVPSTASRAQRLALAAALGTQGLVACALTSDGSDGVGVPVYGAPLAGDQAPPPVAGSNAAPAGRSGSIDGGIAVPVYGLPLAGNQAQPAAGRGGSAGVVAFPAYGVPVAGQPAPDAGALDEDSGVDEGSAGAGGRGGMAVPVYGAPIPEYGAPPPPPPED